MSRELSFPKDKIKIFLFEKIQEAARLTFEAAGYSVTEIADALQGDALNEVLAEAHIVGVRSRTKVFQENLKHAKRLLAIGCFSVGTDQVALDEAAEMGVPVFNAPHSSTRSVAELSIAAVLSLTRRLADKSAKMHQGVWEKSASGSFEIRYKTLGIIGYGHIGQQVGLIAESLGMNVVFYDVLNKLALGRARSVDTLEEMLKISDFVTLHVPGTPETKNLISASKLELMKTGSCLLNMSRGNVVDLDALADALKKKKLSGAAVDVYPSEPAGNTNDFKCPLSGIENVIMTPHIGGSTEEAQRNIGIEVTDALIEFLDNGTTEGAVNFPAVHLPSFPNSRRILNVHRNLPGALSDVNNVIAELGANIDAQYLSTHGNIGYLIMDINNEVSDELKERIAKLDKSIKTRILY